MLVATTPFIDQALFEAGRHGGTALRVLEIDHPFGSRPADQVVDLAEETVPLLVDLLTGQHEMRDVERATML